MSQETSIQVSIVAVEPESRILALQNSRLKNLIKDPIMFAKICEAASVLLSNDKLRACDQRSILGALVTAVNMGFRLQPEYAECYLIPRSINVAPRNEPPSWVQVCTFQVGYRGWKARALESGHIVFLEAREVYREDGFSIKYGTNAEIEHIPSDVNTAETLWFYARARLTKGGEIFQAINKQAAEKYRRFSESQWNVSGTGRDKVRVFSDKPKDVWATSYSKMALRSPIKDLCGMLPLTKAIEDAMDQDGAVNYLEADDTITRLNPVMVEEIAEKIEEPKQEIPVDHQQAYFETTDVLISTTTFADFMENFRRFKGLNTYKNAIFVSLYFKHAARLALTVEDCKEFWTEVKEWQTNTALAKIISKRKTEIESQLKAERK